MIKIVCVGNIKEKFYRDAYNEYVKRLSKYTKFDTFEVIEGGLKDESESNIEKSKVLEGKRILSHINSKDYVILNYIQGNQLSSIELADKIQSLQTSGKSTIVFVIGGSYGVSQEVIDRADYKLSFSKFTMPHQLFRVVLIEQIYRSFKIINKEKYNK